VSEDSLVSGHHVFSCWFTELNLPDRVLECGQFLAWSTWPPILAERCLPELDLFSVRILVDIYVGDTHWDGVRDLFRIGIPEGLCGNNNKVSGGIGVLYVEMSQQV
jgi:hypothetical protein